MTNRLAAASLLTALLSGAAGCTLIDLSTLSSSGSGGAGSSTHATSTQSTSTQTMSTGVTSGTGQTGSSSTGSGCPSFCGASTAKLCDDFDGANPLANWTLDKSNVPPPKIDAGVVNDPVKSCPTAMKVGLLQDLPSPEFLRYEQNLPGSASEFEVNVDVYETIASQDTANTMTVAYDRNGNNCVFILQGFADFASVLTQKLTPSMVLDLDNSGFSISSPANRWVHQRLHITPSGGSVHVEYETDGQSTSATVVDSDCGAGPEPGTLRVFLGMHYEHTAHTTYFDNFEATW